MEKLSIKNQKKIFGLLTISLFLITGFFEYFPEIIDMKYAGNYSAILCFTFLVLWVRVLDKKKIIKIGNHSFQEILSPKEIKLKINEIAKKISNDYSKSDSLVLLFVTNGGMYFGTALSMALQDLGFTHYVDTVRIKRYTGDEKSSTEVKVSSKPSLNLFNTDVIVIEDLVDEGLTMNFLDNYLKTTEKMMPKSIEYCVLVEKKDHVKLSFDIKYYILDKVGPEWLVGFGMDSNFGYRGLRGIYAQID